MIPLTMHALTNNFLIIDENQPVELDVEELENLLYEKCSIPINEVEGSRFSHWLVKYLNL